MDEDADRALGLAEDAGDLGGRHLVDEAEDERLAPVGRQAADGPPRGGGLVAGRDVPPSTSSGSATSAAASIGATGWRRRVRRWFATEFRAIWNSQTRNVDAPSPSAGRARSSNCGRPARAARNVRSVASSAS